MDSFILICNSGLSLNEFCDKIPFQFSDGSLYFGNKNSGNYLNIHNYTNSENEYDQSELEEIKKFIVNPHFYYVDTNSFDLLKVLAKALKENNKAIFDNDREGLITIDKLLEMDSEVEFFK